jgi:hypothetical protein
MAIGDHGHERGHRPRGFCHGPASLPPGSSCCIGHVWSLYGSVVVWQVLIQFVPAGRGAMQSVIECKYGFVLSAWDRIVSDELQWPGNKESAFRSLLHLALDRVGQRLHKQAQLEEAFSLEHQGSSLSCLLGRRGQLYEIVIIGFDYLWPRQPTLVDPGALLHEPRQTLATLAAYTRGSALVIEVVDGEWLNRDPRRHKGGSLSASTPISKFDLIC